MCFLSWDEHASVIVQHVSTHVRAGCLQMLNPLCTPQNIQKKFKFFFSFFLNF